MKPATASAAPVSPAPASSLRPPASPSAARELGISVYDSLYIALAEERGSELLTSDGRQAGPPGVWWE